MKDISIIPFINEFGNIRLNSVYLVENVFNSDFKIGILKNLLLLCKIVVNYLFRNIVCATTAQLTVLLSI